VVDIDASFVEIYRICVELGIQKEGDTVERRTFVSNRAIIPYQWTHVAIRADEDSVDIVIDGQLDSENMLEIIEEFSEVKDFKFCVGILSYT